MSRDVLDLIDPQPHPTPEDTMTEMKPCGAFVYWWNGEYEGNCERPAGHAGPHFDGLSWYDDDMNEVDPPKERTSDQS